MFKNKSQKQNLRTKYNRIERIVRLLRDISILIGLPIFFIIIFNLRQIHIASLEQQAKSAKEYNKILKLVQFDRAISFIESQKHQYEEERGKTLEKVNILINSRNTLENQIKNFSNDKMIIENKEKIIEKNEEIIQLKKGQAQSLELLIKKIKQLKITAVK